MPNKNQPAQQPDKQQDDSRAALAASMMPQTLNAENRTVDVVFFTSPDVPRYDWSKGEPYILRFKPAGADLSLLNNGAPVFDNHDTDMGAAGQMGVVEKGWRDGSEFKATLRFSRRPGVEGLWQDIQDKIVQKFSMGTYILERKELAQEKDKLRVVEVTKWQPYEISTAPLPADFNTRTLSAESADADAAVEARATAHEEQMMAEETITNAGEQAREKTPAPTQTQLADEQLNSARVTGETKERARGAAIDECCAALRLPASFGSKHRKLGTSIEEFRRFAIEEQARIAGQQPEIRHVHPDILNDESDQRRNNMTGALLERFAPGMWAFDDNRREFRFAREGGQRPYEGGRNYAACTLLDIAKECLGAMNIRWHDKSRTEIAQLAFQTTSDFPNILADVANKSLRAGYDMVDSQWRLIAARRTAADFKTVKELTLDSNSRLEKVPESGEFKRGKLVEGKESWSLSTYGKIIGITRQAIINDDLGAFTRTPQLLGQEVAMLEADTVWGIVTANAALADGIALFHSSHGNLEASGATISVDEMGSTRLLMMKQTSPGGKTLSIVPRYIVVPAAKAQLAEVYTSTQYVAATAATINPFSGRLTPIVEPRLDAVDSAAWYMFADPNSPNGTVLIYAYLEGQEGPYTETRNGFDVDGVEIKIRHDFGAAAVDYRGAVKNPGQ